MTYEDAYDTLFRDGHSRDRVSGLSALFGNGQIDVLTLRRLLPDVWTGCEFPSRRRSYWLDLFQVAGYVSDTETKLTGEPTIFRGWTRPNEARGFSWTLDADQACWFAHRCSALGGRARVYEARVSAHDILGYFVDREENEVVVDPRTLRAVRHIDPGEPPTMTSEETKDLRFALRSRMLLH